MGVPGFSIVQAGRWEAGRASAPSLPAGPLTALRGVGRLRAPGAPSTLLNPGAAPESPPARLPPCLMQLPLPMPPLTMGRMAPALQTRWGVYCTVLRRLHALSWAGAVQRSAVSPASSRGCAVALVACGPGTEQAQGLERGRHVGRPKPAPRPSRGRPPPASPPHLEGEQRGGLLERIDRDGRLLHWLDHMWAPA